MKFKKLLLGLGSTLAVVSPIVAVVSCGKDAKTNVSTTQSNILDFDAAIVNHGTTPTEAQTHEQEIIKMQDRIKTGHAEGFIINGKKYLLNDFKKEDGNIVQEGLDALNAELAKYYPSTLEGSLQGLASTGKIEFAKTTFDLPNPGEAFDILADLPKAPKYTRWVASSDQLFLREDGVEAPTEERWWPIEGWKRPYTDQNVSITFKIKLVPDIGYKIVDNNLTTLTFRATHLSVSQEQLLSTIKMSSHWDADENKMVTTITQKDGVASSLKATFNTQDAYSFDNTKLNEKINIHLTKMEGITYPENQVFDYTITPSNTLMLPEWGGTFPMIGAIRIDNPSNRMPLKIGDKTYYYHIAGETVAAYSLTRADQGFFTVKDFTTAAEVTSTKVANGVITGSIYLGHDSAYMTNNILEAAVQEKSRARMVITPGVREENNPDAQAANSQAQPAAGGQPIIVVAGPVAGPSITGSNTGGTDGDAPIMVSPGEQMVVNPPSPQPQPQAGAGQQPVVVPGAIVPPLIGS